MNEIQFYRGSIFHLLEDPKKGKGAYEYFDDGLLVVQKGVIDLVGDYNSLKQELPKDLKIVDYRDRLIIPGFIDSHVHFPQTKIIGAYGKQLIDWLNNYAFPEEEKFSDRDYAEEAARFFIDQLLTNGTTTGLVFATVHKESVDALFDVSQKKRLRMLAGKVMMDRNAPASLLDSAETGVNESRELIKKWHEKDRLLYAITPRFAPTSTPEQLRKAGELLNENPTLYMQTHLSENADELAWVKGLFPERKNYLDVYDHYGLVTTNSVFAHSIHLSDDEYQLMRDRGASASFCPTSNLFLGSGLFDLEKINDHGITVSLGTDVGGGNSFSMFRVMSEAYKVCQLRNQTVDPFELFYLATLGAARVLHLEDKIGNLSPTSEADFVVLNPNANPLLRKRLENCESLLDKLFAIIMLGDDRLIEATYSLGNKVYKNVSIQPRDG